MCQKFEFQQAANIKSGKQFGLEYLGIESFISYSGSADNNKFPDRLRLINNIYFLWELWWNDLCTDSTKTTN